MRLWRSGANPVPLTVPQIFRGAEYIGGSDRLEAYLRSHGL
jgi:glutaredoxin